MTPEYREEALAAIAAYEKDPRFDNMSALIKVACKALPRALDELRTVGPITLCEKCGGTGYDTGGHPDYPASACCPIGHAKECKCFLCAWRDHGRKKDAELARKDVLRDENRDLRAEAERLRWALVPFAAMHRPESNPRDIALRRGHVSDATCLFNRDFERAAAALSPAAQPVVKDSLITDPKNTGKSLQDKGLNDTGMVCKLCGCEAEFRDYEQVWRHAGGRDVHNDRYIAQIFCDKYGYPIEVVAPATQPVADECRNVLFPGDPSTCQDDPCRCAAQPAPNSCWICHKPKGQWADKYAGHYDNPDVLMSTPGEERT